MGDCYEFQSQEPVIDFFIMLDHVNVLLLTSTLACFNA